MDKDAPGVDVGTKCGHLCVRLDGRIKKDFDCCICAGEAQLCASCEKRKLWDVHGEQKDESDSTSGSRKH